MQPSASPNSVSSSRGSAAEPGLFLVRRVWGICRAALSGFRAAGLRSRLAWDSVGFGLDRSFGSTARFQRGQRPRGRSHGPEVKDSGDAKRALTCGASAAPENL